MNDINLQIEQLIEYLSIQEDMADDDLPECGELDE